MEDKLLLKTNEGFTFIELLFTLLLLSLFLSLPIFYFQSQDKTIQKQTIEQFKHDLVYAQHVAMIEGKVATVRFEDNTLILFVDQKEKRRVVYPTNVEIEPVTIKLEDVSFLANGHPRKSGSWDVRTEHFHVRFTVQIGKGHIVYRQQ